MGNVFLGAVVQTRCEIIDYGLDVGGLRLFIPYATRQMCPVFYSHLRPVAWSVPFLLRKAFNVCRIHADNSFLNNGKFYQSHTGWKLFNFIAYKLLLDDVVCSGSARAWIVFVTLGPLRTSTQMRG